MMSDIKSLAHTKWNCKYHIVFAPKYRRQVFYGEKKRAIGEILRRLCEWKGINIIEAECCPDHIHMLVEIPPKMSVSGFMGYLKGTKRHSVKYHPNLYKTYCYYLIKYHAIVQQNLRRHMDIPHFLGYIRG